MKYRSEENKRRNVEWIKAERCEWDLPNFEDEEFTIVDELMIRAPDGFGIDETVTEQYLEEHPKLKEWWDEDRYYYLYF